MTSGTKFSESHFCSNTTALHHKFGLIWCTHLNYICVKKRLDENDHVHKTTHEQKSYTQNGKRIFSHQNSRRRVNTEIFVHRKISRGSHAMVSISIPDTPLLNYFIIRFNTHTWHTVSFTHFTMLLLLKFHLFVDWDRWDLHCFLSIMYVSKISKITQKDKHYFLKVCIHPNQMQNALPFVQKS